MYNACSNTVNTLGTLYSYKLSDRSIMVDSPHDNKLRGNPFDDDSSVFFAGSGRQAMLDTIVRICQCENSLIAVRGDSGVGKTTLIHQLPQHLGDASICCLATASPLTATKDILQQIAYQLGVTVPAEASAAESIAEIISAIEQQIISAKLHSVLVMVRQII